MKQVADASSVTTYEEAVTSLKASPFWKGEFKRWFDNHWLTHHKVYELELYVVYLGQYLPLKPF